MDYLIWKEEYNLGIEEIDKQHHHWSILINKLYEARNDSNAGKKITIAFNEMLCDMEQHFKTEESLLERNECPNVEKMQKAHKEVLDRAKKIDEEFKKNGDASDLMFFLKFLREYFVSHTQRVDREYMNYLKPKYIVWKKEYNFGIEEIDNHHNGIAELINVLYEKLVFKNGVDKEGILIAIDKLIDFSQMHFEYEEELVKKHDYHFMDELIKEHRDIISQLSEKKGDFLRTGKGLGADVMPFYRDWLITHTQGTDRKYLPFILTE